METARSRDLAARVEAALYASGKPISLEDLCRAAGVSSKKKMQQLVADLQARVKETFVALEVAEYPGERYVMQLKPSLTSMARKFASRPLLASPLLKTLSFVAFFQPITSAELALRRGSQVYQHLRILRELGFLAGEKFGRTRLYKTTSRFAEYFGLNPENQDIKRQLREIGGITEPPLPAQTVNA